MLRKNFSSYYPCTLGLGFDDSFSNLHLILLVSDEKIIMKRLEPKVAGRCLLFADC